MNATLRLKINGTAAGASEGETLMNALIAAGYFVDAPCSGGGRCGKCRVIASGALSDPSERELELLGGDAERGYRLACIARLTGDAEVTLPERGAEIQVAGMTADFDFTPAARLVRLEITPPTVDAPVPFDENLKRTLGSGIEISEAAAVQLAGFAADGLKEAFAAVAGNKVVRLYKSDEPVYGLAADIGTTTVAVYLVNLSDGKIAAADAFENPQKVRGADVISRIEACVADGSPARLNAMITGAINASIGRLCDKTGIDAERIAACAVAGNTVMEHIFANLPPMSIAAAPFAPVTLFGREYAAAALGLNVAPDAPVYLAPCVASYVGGDITSGIVAAGLFGKKGTRLYIDVGTNGELALCRDGKFTFAATAAGPAFEGAHIEMGMSALTGAVRSVKIRGGAIEAETVCGASAVGICGSGLISAVAAFIETGDIDETGRIIGGDRLYVADGVYLTGADIREIQLAKAAVAAGINTLLDDAGITAGELDEIILAGGFGTNIDAEAACAIGMLPRGMSGKVTAAGNTAGGGMVKYLVSETARVQIERIRGVSSYLELSGSDFFMDDFIEQMTFE